MGTVLLRIVPLRIVPHHRAARGRPVAHSFRRTRPILPTGRKVGTRPGRTLVLPASHVLRAGRAPHRKPARALLRPVQDRVLPSRKRAPRPNMKALLRKKSTRDYRLVRGRIPWPVLLSALAFFLASPSASRVLIPGPALTGLVPSPQGSAVTRPGGTLLLQFFTPAVAPKRVFLRG